MGDTKTEEEAWLYNSSKEASEEQPSATDDDNSQVPDKDDQPPEASIVDPESTAKPGEQNNDNEKEEGEEEDDEEEEDDDDDDEDEIEVHIGDAKSAAPAAGSFPSGTVNLNIKKPLATTAVASSAPGQVVRSSQKGIDVDAVASIQGVNIYEFNIDSLEDKPWRKPGADVTDYFNYGFTEDTWKIYCDRQRRLRGDSANMGVKSLVSQVPVSQPYEKPYKQSFQSRERDFRKSGTIDVIGGANSRRHDDQMPPQMMPPMNDMQFPQGMPPNAYEHPHNQMQPMGHHGMPPHGPPPVFDPRYHPPMDMPPPFDPYAGPPHGMMGAPDFMRNEERPMMPEDLEYQERRRHHRSRDDREEREYREERERRHRDRGERDDRRDREDREPRRDKEREREHRDHREGPDGSRHGSSRSSRKSRRHEDDEDERRSSKHKRSKRDEDER